MLLFGKRHSLALNKEVTGLRLRNPAGIQFSPDNPPSMGKKRILAGFITLNPPQNNVLQWITNLQEFRKKTVLAVNLKTDIVRTFSLVYDFADFIIVDPDTDNGIDSPDIADITMLLEELVSLRMCYERYTPIFLRISHGITPDELHSILACCQLSGLDGAVVQGLRKVQLTLEETKGRLPVIGCAENAQEALDMLQQGASLVETNLRPIGFAKLLKMLENQQSESK